MRAVGRREPEAGVEPPISRSCAPLVSSISDTNTRPMSVRMTRPFDKAALSQAMAAPEVLLRLDLGLGDGRGEAFGCDLTQEYVIENSEYTT